MQQHQDEADALVQLVLQKTNAVLDDLDIRSEVSESSRDAFLERMRNGMPVFGTGDACG